MLLGMYVGLRHLAEYLFKLSDYLISLITKLELSKEMLVQITNKYTVLIHWGEVNTFILNLTDKLVR